MNNPRKILITGASGFIGTWLVKRALESGANVRAVARGGTLNSPPGFDWDPSPFTSSQLEVVSADVTDSQAVRPLMQGCSQVFHLAGFAKVWAKDRDAFRRVNVEGTANVLSAAREAGVERVVHTSSGVTFGMTPSGQLRDESTPRIPKQCFTEYEATKLEAEELVLRRAADGQDIVIVNPTRVYGPGHLNESNSLPLLLKDYLNGRMPFLINRGANFSNYVFIDDVVEGHLLAMEKGRSGERYLLGGENVTLRELAEQVDELSGRRHFRISIGKAIPMMYAYFEATKAKVFGIPPKITPGWARMFVANEAYDNSKAQRELEFSPRSFSEGLKITYDWMGQVCPTKDHQRQAKSQQQDAPPNS